MHRLFVVLLLSLAQLGIPDQSAAAKGLTLSQLIATALRESKELQAARFVEAKARARLVQAGLLPNPSLELSNKNDRLFANEGEYTTSIGFSQKFPVAGRIARQKDVARVDIDLALAEISEAERKHAGEVATAFYRALILNRQIEARDHLIEFDRKLLEAARNRFRAAEVSEIDVNVAQLDLQRLSQERASLVSERLTQLGQLNQLLGRAATQPLALDETIPSMDTLPSLADQQRRALDHRPDLRSAVLNVRRARADQELARAERFEDWTVGVGVERSRTVIEGAPPQPSNNALALNLSIPLPLLNNNEGRIAETIATGAQANAQIAALRQSISNEVARVFAEIKRLQQAIIEYEFAMLPLSESNVRLTLDGYGRGQVPINDVVQAGRQQADVNIAYLATLDLYLQAWAKLRTATADYLK